MVNETREVFDMNKETLHKIRIKNDYNLMRCMQNHPVVSWVATKGNAPYIEEYLLTIKLKIYINKTEVTDCEIIRLTLPLDYPFVAPIVVIESSPIFHPDWWYESRRWNCGCYHARESLFDFTVRMMKSLQYRADSINPYSPCSREAANWYIENKDNHDMFPTDNQELPMISANLDATD